MGRSESGQEIWEKQQRFIEQAIVSRLNDHPAWPRSVFRLELEKANIYQDRSNKILHQLEGEGVIGSTSVELNDNEIPFITRPESPTPSPEDEIKEATEALNSFYLESSDFSELTAFTALCKIDDEIGDNITGTLLRSRLLIARAAAESRRGQGHRASGARYVPNKSIRVGI
uniref:hypothetical protein n=1 Tax=Haloarcula sp. CGMCC 1.2071 TaxID=3111454 RepID=UPI00300EABED